MSLDAVLDRVRKLRALAKSDNANEAAAAAAAAERLIQQHRLSEADLSEPESIVDDEIPIDVYGPQPILWRVRLLTGLCERYGCTSYGFEAWHPLRKGEKVFVARIVGRPDDIAAVRYLLEWLKQEGARLADLREWGATAGRVSYLHGFVSGCMNAMASADREARASASSSALVLLDQRKGQADQALQRLKGEMSTLAPEREALDPGPYFTGARDGEAMTARKRLR